MNDHAKAANACRDYEYWASEVARLTEAISDEECPHENYGDESDGYYEAPSCFHVAAKETFYGHQEYPDEPPPTRRRTLDGIGKEVADCESCSRLVGFIRDRKEAKKRLGVAKRQVRVVGKRILKGGPENG